MERPSTERERWLTTKRIESLSDAVFAFAMTLLIINVRVPAARTEGEVLGELLTLWPHFLAFATSFLVLAVFWIVHHKHFNVIKRANEPLLWLNILFLLFVVLIPFSTAMMGEYGHTLTATVFFELNLFAAGMALYLNFWYATDKHRLVAPDMDERQIAKGRHRNLLIPIVSMVAVAFSFVSPRWSTLVYMLIPLILATAMKD